MTFIKYLGPLGVEPPRANLLSTVEPRFRVRNAFWLYIVFSVTVGNYCGVAFEKYIYIYIYQMQ